MRQRALADGANDAFRSPRSVVALAAFVVVQTPCQTTPLTQAENSRRGETATRSWILFQSSLAVLTPREDPTLRQLSDRALTGSLEDDCCAEYILYFQASLPFVYIPIHA
jgi:hypothetical protein